MAYWLTYLIQVIVTVIYSPAVVHNLETCEFYPLKGVIEFKVLFYYLPLYI